MNQGRIIATGPHGFAGAGQILAFSLSILSEAGYNVTLVSARRPFARHVLTREVESVVVDQVKSAATGPWGALGSASVALGYLLAEAMVDIALTKVPQGGRVVLWGTYLFPYGLSAWLARRLLEEKGIKPSLWITLCGSDVWELGPQLRHVASGVLNDPIVTNLMTYSGQFAEEIANDLAVKKYIEVVRPAIDFGRFRPVDHAVKIDARQRLGVSEYDFIISCHSNMRPVKAPEDVIHIAEAVARRTKRHVVLIMVGPAVSRKKLSGYCDIIWHGVARYVERVLWAADVELNCSRHDSFNVSLAEAMACGIPCATTHIAGIAPDVRAAGGFVFQYMPPGNGGRERYVEVAEWIAELSCNEEERSRLGTIAATYARERFRREDFLESMSLMLAGADDDGKTISTLTP